MDLWTAAQIVGVVLVSIAGAGAIVGVVILWGKQAAAKVQLDMFIAANGELRAENTELRAKAEVERKDCQQRIARLEGQMSALTDGVAHQIVAAVVDELKKEIPG